MFAVSLAVHLWLLGSVLLPLMLLLRWCGAHWSVLRWLTCSTNRWNLIWRWYGFLKVFALAIPAWLKYSYLGGLDFLGWSGGAAVYALYALHIRIPWLAIYYWLIVLLSAMTDGLTYFGFAAFSWRVFNRAAETTSGRPPNSTVKNYGAALLVSACLWGVANNLHARRMQTCSDCFWPHGIPFTFYHEGGLRAATVMFGPV